MTGPTVAHLTTAIAVVGGGMLVGHVLAPYGAGAGPERRVLFAAVLLAIGVWRGRAEVFAWAEWHERVPRPATARIAAGVGALASVLLAVAGYVAVHG